VAGLPFIAAGVLVLVGSRITPFLRRHGVAALRLQLWQVLLLIPTPVLFFLTLGIYSAVVLAALLGGIGYALFGAVRALTGDERAYPGDWPARARPVPVAVDSDQREGRARWALGRAHHRRPAQMACAPTGDVMPSDKSGDPPAREPTGQPSARPAPGSP
jgi:hypothetical protein